MESVWLIICISFLFHNTSPTVALIQNNMHAAASSRPLKKIFAAETPAPAPAPVIQSNLHDNGFLEIRLNRPEKFNCLNLEMLSLMHEAMDHVTDSSAVVKGIVLTAVQGKAFCAGGDIKFVEGLPSAHEKIEFLFTEYSLHQRIYAAAQRMPVVAIADGIVMGAGAGLFMAANVRVVTNRTIFAMPETNIGLIPDAGALHFMRKICPPTVGLYACVTGARLSTCDVIHTGLGTHFVPSTHSAESVTSMLVRDLTSSPAKEYRRVISRHVASSLDDLTGFAHGSLLDSMRPCIDDCFTLGPANRGRDDMDAMMTALKAQHQKKKLALVATRDRKGSGMVEPNEREAEASVEFLNAALNLLSSRCPMAVTASLIGHRASAASSLNFRDSEGSMGDMCAEMEEARAIELVINGHLVTRSDFTEGVACAVGVRRGEAPRWEGTGCDHVTIQAIESDIEHHMQSGTLTLNGVRDRLLLVPSL